MTPDGRLAAEPILIEASASMKGPLLMQGAIRALQACQPYAMLPVGPLRRMEGARSQLHATGFYERLVVKIRRLVPTPFPTDSPVAVIRECRCSLQAVAGVSG
jgi:hypothetical protein